MHFIKYCSKTMVFMFRKQREIICTNIEIYFFQGAFSYTAESIVISYILYLISYVLIYINDVFTHINI